MSSDLPHFSPTLAPDLAKGLELANENSVSSSQECEHFPRCGGCQTLDQPYLDQLSLKQKTIEKVFQAFPQMEIRPILGCTDPRGYRYKVQLPFGWDAQNRQVLVGCFATGSHEVINQKSCLVQDSELSALAYAMRAWAQEEGLSVYDETKQIGCLRHLILRKGFGTGEVLAGLVIHNRQTIRDRHWDSLRCRLQQALGNRAPALKGLVALVNADPGNTVLIGEEELIWGQADIDENLNGLHFRLRANTFFQVNPAQAIHLFNAAVSPFESGQRVLDLYCGTGTFTQWAARKTGYAEGWEANVHSVAAAKLAAAANGLTNETNFEIANIRDRLPILAASAAAIHKNQNWDAVIVDPPRKGLDASTCHALNSMNNTRLVYVSCNPNSLQRDLQRLQASYAVISLQPVDMMPHTRHIECVVHLKRK